ncbi:MAG: hypothetical protein AAF564_07170 [Bacteroidota bacterium]
MAEKAKNNKEQYRQARDEFDSLKIEEKAIFLVESTFAMLAHGIEAVGNVFAEQVNNMYKDEEAAEEAAEEAPKPAPKKRTTTKKSTTTRKRSTSTRTRKSTPKKEE